jgi:hypothetical protein
VMLGGCQAKDFGSFYECELCNLLPSNPKTPRL